MISFLLHGVLWIAPMVFGLSGLFLVIALGPKTRKHKMVTIIITIILMLAVSVAFNLSLDKIILICGGTP